MDELINDDAPPNNATRVPFNKIEAIIGHEDVRKTYGRASVAHTFHPRRVACLLLCDWLKVMSYNAQSGMVQQTHTEAGIQIGMMNMR